jgi:hypothetical protein
MKRRDAVVSLTASGVGALLSSCTSSNPKEVISDQQAALFVRQMTGIEMKPGQWAAIQESLKQSRFTSDVDATIQPQSDFDPVVDL